MFMLIGVDHVKCLFSDIYFYFDDLLIYYYVMTKWNAERCISCKLENHGRELDFLFFILTMVVTDFINTTPVNNHEGFPQSCKALLRIYVVMSNW